MNGRTPIDLPHENVSLKILHFYKTYLPQSYGGAEQFIFQLVRGSVRRGIDAEVLSLSPQRAAK